MSIVVRGLTTAFVIAALPAALAFLRHPSAAVPPPASPRLELVQPDLFSAPGGQPNAWADFDNHGDLDEFVGLRGRANRRYGQTRGQFQDAAAASEPASNTYLILLMTSPPLR